MRATGKAKLIGVRAVVNRSDGTVEDLGLVAGGHWWKFWRVWFAKRRIRAANQRRAARVAKLKEAQGEATQG